jgi:hypothetical protein
MPRTEKRGNGGRRERKREVRRQMARAPSYRADLRVLRVLRRRFCRAAERSRRLHYRKERIEHMDRSSALFAFHAVNFFAVPSSVSVSSAEGSAAGQNGGMLVPVFLISTFTQKERGARRTDGEAEGRI